MNERTWWWAYFIAFALLIIGYWLVVLEVYRASGLDALVKAAVILTIIPIGVDLWVKMVHALKHALWGTCTPHSTQIGD